MGKKLHKLDIKTPDPGYEPFPVSIMNRSTYEATIFDPTLGKPATISYRLNKAGCIRIRLSHRDQPKIILRTLIDWTNQEFGQYAVPWEGCDSSGNIVENKRILFLFEAKDQSKCLQHQEHDEGKCRDPLLKIETQPDSYQIVKGPFEIRTTLTGGEDNLGHKRGYEVRYFINYKLVNDLKNHGEVCLTIN